MVAAKSFSDVLLEQCKRKGEHKSRRASRLILLLEAPKTKRRQRLIDRLEKDARAHLENEGYVIGDDWSEVGERDWNSFFESLIQFIIKLLPLIAALF